MNGGWAIGAAAVLLVVTFISVVQYLNAERLNAEGVWTEATVVRKWISRGGDSPDDYMLKLQFLVSSEEYYQDVEVSRNEYQQTLRGDQKKLKYWPTNPDISEFRAGETQRSARWLQVIALVSGVLSVFILWFVGHKSSRAVLARRYGFLTKATIENIVERKKSGEPTGFGYMQFRSQSGAMGESLNRSMRDLLLLGIGAEIDVFEREGELWWEGDVGPRAKVPRDFPKVN